MWFPVPLDLVDFEYFEVGEEKAGGYSREQDLAFFVINFGYSRDNYLDLRPIDAMFIRKAYESNFASKYEMLQTTIISAIGNCLSKHYTPLFQKVDKRTAEDKKQEAQALLNFCMENADAILQSAKGKK